MNSTQCTTGTTSGSSADPACRAGLRGAAGVARLIPYRKGDKWGYCDWEKNIVIPATYDEAFPFDNGLAQVTFQGRYGFVDVAGDAVVDLAYDEVQPFCNGLARVQRAGKYGFGDARGKHEMAKQLTQRG